MKALAEEYRELQTEDYDSADSTFLEMYGEDVLAAVQPKTAGVEYSLPMTAEAVAWVTANPEVDELAPHTYGFFAPQGGEFDYSLYQKQFAKGQRKQLTLQEWTRLMNTTKAKMRLEDAMAQVGEDADTVEGRDYIREVRDYLAEEYDGFGDKAGIPGRPDTDVLIRELYDAVKVKAIKETDAGKGLAMYLQGRDEVLADAQSQGYAGFAEADDMEDGRIYLNELAGYIIEKHPGFKPIFDVVLSRETEVEVDG